MTTFDKRLEDLRFRRDQLSALITAMEIGTIGVMQQIEKAKGGVTANDLAYWAGISPQAANNRLATLLKYELAERFRVPMDRGRKYSYLLTELWRTI